MTDSGNNDGRELSAEVFHRTVFTTLDLAADASIAVGLSGGLDSVVLLHLLCALRNASDIELTALHAHHGMHRDADKWQDFCERVCNEWSVQFTTQRLKISVCDRLGPEARARKARYRWFEDRMRAGDALVLAHHRDDQAETVLLNLLRGSGTRGLSAMSPIVDMGKYRLVRPLLRHPRREIQAYASKHRLEWIEDVSNYELKFSRNLIRNRILPKLKERWPAVDDVLAGTAIRMEQTQALLDEVAVEDLARIQEKPTDPLSGQGFQLRLSPLLSLSRQRLYNFLNYWFRLRGLERPTHRQLDLLVAEFLREAPPSTASLQWSHTAIRRYDDWLYVLQGADAEMNPRARTWDLRAPMSIPELKVQLVPVRVRGDGLARDRIQSSTTIRWRRGGERCRLPNRHHHNALKKLLQQHRVPPWVRGRIPLIYMNDEIAAVGGYWYCEPYVARPGEAGIAIEIRAIQAERTD